MIWQFTQHVSKDLEIFPSYIFFIVRLYFVRFNAHCAKYKKTSKIKNNS